jgi:DNA-binding PadR family transcriptional regulator
MSTVRLLVLGSCRRRGRSHGYAIHRDLAEWRVETWTLVRPGSIYHALRQLAADGYLRAVGEEPGARGPGRTVYEVTPAGHAEFIRLLEVALASFALDELGSGIAFMDALPRARAIELLREQQRRAIEARENLEVLTSAYPDRTPAPHTRDLLELWSGNLAATAAWMSGMVERLEGGEYAMAGDQASDAAVAGATSASEIR